MFRCSSFSSTSLRKFPFFDSTSTTTATLVSSCRHLFFMGSSMSSSVRSSASNTALPSEVTAPRVNKSEAEWRSVLTPKQFAVLRHGATDPRGSGEYNEHYEAGGVYVCAGCKNPLYTSEMKWDCGCGWPGFYSCVSKAVLERPDKDGSGRAEIVCSGCFGHLGHVFRGEGFSNPPPNERHCVNSTSIAFVKKGLKEFMAAANKSGVDDTYQ